MAQQVALFMIWRMAIRELTVDHAVTDGCKVGGSQKAPSMSTWPSIPDKSLQVGGLVDAGWGCGSVWKAVFVAEAYYV